jgi:thiamine biosynthesis lipoprotein
MTVATQGYVQTRVYMDTAVTIQVSRVTGSEVEDRVERAFGWFREVERRCSRFDPVSELRRLCARPGVPVAVSPLLFGAVDFALSVAEASGGAFDPTIGAAQEARGFDRNYRTGERSQTSAGLGASYRDVQVDRASLAITLDRPLLLDLGAVAKGLAIDLAAQELASLPGFSINAGGDIRVKGPNPDAEPWRIGIRGPNQPEKLLGAVALTDGAVCTSGGYERPDASGRGHHLLDPATGDSPRDLAGVTVVAPTAMVADALSTAAFVLGADTGLQLVESAGAEGLFVTSDGRSLMTDGFEAFLA